MDKEILRSGAWAPDHIRRHWLTVSAKEHVAASTFYLRNGADAYATIGMPILSYLLRSLPNEKGTPIMLWLQKAGCGVDTALRVSCARVFGSPNKLCAQFYQLTAGSPEVLSTRNRSHWKRRQDNPTIATLGTMVAASAAYHRSITIPFWI